MTPCRVSRRHRSGAWAEALRRSIRSSGAGSSTWTGPNQPLPHQPCSEELDSRTTKTRSRSGRGSGTSPGLQRVTVAQTQPATLKADAAYLVTGGLGILGLKIAHWLAEQGARHLTLMGRRRLADRAAWASHPAGQRRFPADRRHPGDRTARTTVEVAALDVADEPQLTSLSRSLRTDGTAAARNCARRVGRLDPAGCGIADRRTDGHAQAQSRRDMGPSPATEAQDLDFFVLFSSMAALLGSVDLGHYAAANSFLDSFAPIDARPAARRSASTGGLGGHAGSGGPGGSLFELRHAIHAGRSGTRRLWAGCGRATSPRWALPRSTGRPSSRCTKPDGAGRFSIASPPATPRSRSARQNDRAIAPKPRSRKRRRSPDAAERARRERRQPRCSACPPTDRRARKGLFDLGMDSLMSVELKSRLEAATGCALPTTLTFKYPTVVALTDFLGERLGLESATATGVRRSGGTGGRLVRR